ncbi:MAG: dihydrofolate reductase [Porphyromonadaceae bacterium]|nr:dihydrofolate reductase [Porphyromonadaceae bacterium]
MSKISIIAAVAENYVIGKNNKLPWHLPADLKHFKNKTIGHAVVMGKRTFESLPNGPLPKRKNIVLTSIPEGNYDKYYEAVSLGDAIDLCENEAEVYIIGGASLFKQALVYPEINTMYITWIHAEVSGDAYFPKFDENEWKLVSSERHEADEKNEYAYTFAKYEKKVK